MHASVNVGCQCKSGPGKIHEVILVLFVLIAAAVIVLWLGGIVFVVCSIVVSKGCKPFM